MPPTDAPEKAVKILLENHRLMLTLVGFLIAGLFAYGGRNANVLEWRYFAAEACFIIAGILVVVAVSVAIDQARTDNWDAHSRWMTIPYTGALILIALGLSFTAWFMIWPPLGSPSLPALSSGIRIEGGKIQIAPDTKLKIRTQHDSASGNVQVIEITP